MEDNKKKFLKSPIKGIKKLENFKSNIQTKQDIPSKEELSDLLLQGENKKAYDIVLRSRQIKTDDSRLYFLMGIICKINKDYNWAKKFLVDAYRIEPEEKRIVYELAGLYTDCKEYDEALNLLEKNLLLESKETEIHNILALIYMGKDNLDAAKQNFIKVLRSRSDVPNIFFNYAIFLNKINKHRIAIKYYKKILLRDEENIDVKFNLSLSYIVLNKYEEAKKGLEEILAIDPFHIGGLINIGIICLRRRETDKALEAFNKVISIDENNHSALVNLANISHSNGIFEDAIHFANKILANDQDNIDAQNILAGSFYELSQYKKSIQCSKKILQRDEFNVHALMNLINNYFVVEDYENLDSYSSQLREIDPCNPLLASLDPLVSIINGKKNKSLFIDNPLDYIKEFNLNDYSEDANTLISKIIALSRSITSEYNPQGKTTIGGLQTLPTIFDSNSNEINTLETIIRNCIKTYIETLNHKDTLFINRWPNPFEIQGWTVFLEKLGMQKSHNHLSGWMSGVIYLKVPRIKNSENEGAIEFSLHGYDYPGKDLNTPKKVLQPSVGSVVLFPSSLFHKTIPFNSNEERISLAFDVLSGHGGRRIDLGN